MKTVFLECLLQWNHVREQAPSCNIITVSMCLFTPCVHRIEWINERQSTKEEEE